MPAHDLAERLPRFTPETDLERAVAADPELLEGLAWGEPRYGHPEGAVGPHVCDLLEEIERRGERGERRSMLRFVVLVHDSMKYKVRDWLPKTGENHHAMRARRAPVAPGQERLSRHRSPASWPTRARPTKPPELRVRGAGP